MKLVFLCIVGLLVTASGVYGDDGHAEHAETHADIFEPEEDWKVIKEGQHIPGGLDVRINMSTGVKEARLMRNEDGSIASVPAAHRELVALPAGKEDKLRRKEVSHQAQKIEEGTGLGSLTDLLNWAMQNTGTGEKAPEEAEKPHQNMTPKELLELVHEVMPSDFDQMKKLLAVAKNTDGESTAEDRLRALDDLEYVLHQIDNAMDFEKMKGLTALIEMLKDTNPHIVAAAAQCLGTASQNNEKVQEQVLELGAVEALVDTLRRVERGNAEHGEGRDVFPEALYAVSSIIRSYSPAEDRFSSLNGYQLLRHGVASKDNKVARKSLNLVSDLFAHPSHEGLESDIRANGLCEAMPALLSRPDTDLIESVVTTMEAIKTVCALELMDKTHGVPAYLPALEEFVAKEAASSDSEDHTDYLKQLLGDARALVDGTVVV